jgi:acetolactate synthase-1/2/3 large subunit
MTDLGDRLIASLAAAGIDAVFGVPGGQTLPLYRAARAASTSGFRHVLMRDERSAACAADAYARVRGHVGVCDATVGPGVTNLVSGLAEAYSSSIPVLAVVADIRSDQGHLRRRSVASQAAEQSAILAPVTKWVARVERAAAFDDVFAQALRVATTGRPGPVALEIPEDVFTEPPRDEAPLISRQDAAFPRFRPALARRDVERVAALLAESERPVVFAGGGVIASGACEALIAFAEATAIPVVTTIMGKGAIDERHELSLGVVGTFGCVRANAALIEADAVFVIGSKLDQLSTIGFRMPRRSQRVAHIDVDGEEIGRVAPAEIGAVADAREALSALCEHVRASEMPRHRRWFSELPSELEGDGGQADAGESDGVAPDAVVTTICEAFPAGATLVVDASLASGWAARYFRVARTGRSFLAPRGLAGIGWSGGAAIGASVAAAKESRVVALAGDGAWGYTMAEVETAARAGLPITYVILNNASYGWVAHTETDLKIPELSHLGKVDYAAAAAALGAKAFRAHTIDEFAHAFSLAIGIDGPAVVEVLSSPSASPTLRIRDVVRAIDAAGGKRLPVGTGLPAG